MGLKDRYEICGKHFSSWCDANEYSWQLCSRYVESLPDKSTCRIRRYDNTSFGVLDTTTQEYVMVANVVKL